MKEIVSTVTGITYLLSTIVLFSVLIVTYVNIINTDHGYMQSVGVNWSRSPIKSVKTYQSNYDSCPAGSYSLIQDYWPGTVEGCYCSFEISVLGPLRRGWCRRKRDSWIFCKDVYSVPAVPYNKWRGRNLCAERAEDTFLDLITAKNAGSCPLNTRSCGVVDSLNNVLCISNTQQCPINYIKFGTATEAAPTDAKYEVAEIENGKIFTTTEKINDQIPVEFKVSEGQPCTSPAYMNYQTTPYMLDFFYDKNVCKTSTPGVPVLDLRYQILDAETNEYLFTDNGIKRLTQTLPQYPIQNLSAPTRLWVRGYIGLNPECKARIKAEGSGSQLLTELVKLNSYMSYAIGMSLAIMILGILLFIIILFLVPLHLCLAFDSKNRILFYIAPTVFVFVIFIMAAVTAGYLKSYESIAQILGDVTCVDAITSKTANNFYDKLDYAKTYMVTGTFLSALMLVIPIIDGILACVC